MSCKPTYKGIRYNSLEELYRANGINSEQKQQAQQLYSQYLENLSTNNIKPGVTELFESNPDFANKVYEALGFNNKVSSKVELKHKIAHVYDIIYNGKRIGNFELPLDLEGSSVLIGDVEIDEKYRGKGLGVETYKAAINLSNKPIISLLATDEANRVWESLVRQGLAEKTENGYKSVKPQITPQQKQEAQQLYSSYLQTTNNPTIEGFKQWNNKQQQINELFESNPELANSVYEALGFKEQQYVSKLKEIAGRRKLATKSDLENSQLIKDLRVDKSQPKELKPNAADNNLAAIMLYGMRMSELEDKGLSEEKMEATTLAYRILNDFIFDMDELSFYEDILSENPEYASILSTNENPVKEFFENDIFEQADKEKFEITPEQKQQAQKLYSQYLDTKQPDVILPIGTSGSGKSTFIKSLPQENLVVIEPDAMRVEFTGNMNDKSKDKEIYIEAAKRAIKAIKQGKQVVFDTTNLTKDKRLPFIEAIKKEIPNANIQYKLMELNPELAKQRIKAQLERGENRAAVSDETIDRHAASYKQMLEDIKNEPITEYKELGSKQDIQGFKEFVQGKQLLSKQDIEGFKDFVQGKQFQKLTAEEKARTIEQVTKENRSIAALKDLSAKLAHRIGGKVRFKNRTDVDWKGYNKGMTSVLNEAYMTPDTPFHEILAHPIIKAIKNRNIKNLTIEEQEDTFGLLTSSGNPGIVYTIWEAGKGSKETFDTKIEAENYIQSLKDSNIIYQNLLKELETGRGKEVFEQVKRDYTFKKDVPHMSTIDKDVTLYYDKNTKTGYIHDNNNPSERKTFNSEQEVRDYLNLNDKYTLEEQQEEAIVTLLGELAAGKLEEKENASLKKKLLEFWKQISDFVRQLLLQDEIRIDELPITTTLNDLAKIMAYGNNKIILPGYKVEYSTPLGNKYDTLEEVNNEIRGLADGDVVVDLSSVKVPKNLKDIPNEFTIILPFGDYIVRNENGIWNKYEYDKNIIGRLVDKNLTFEEVKKEYLGSSSSLVHFIEKNKEYEQSKEIIEQWKKDNNIRYDPEEVYSRGQGFYSSIGAYSNLELDLLLKNLIQHIEDNKKAGGEFTISAFTRPIDKRLKHIEGTGERVRFVIYPQSNHIKWAAPTDVHSGSVWDAHEKVSKDKKSELLGVSFTKAPTLGNINAVSPNLANIIDNLSHVHNELGIELTTNNFRIEYDDNIDYSTKKLIDNINKILDDKYGKLKKPEINVSNKKEITFNVIEFDPGSGEPSIIYNAPSKENADNFIKEQISKFGLNRNYYKIEEKTIQQGIQPTQTKENTTSIESVKDKIDKENYSKYGGQEAEEGMEFIYPEKHNKKEYTSQAEINLKVAALKEVARKYSRSLITSKVVPINPNMVDNSEIQYSKKENKVKSLAERKGVTYNDINNINVFC